MDKKSAAGASYNTGICHVMPCSIEEDMTAPTAVYFHPTLLPSEAMSDSCARVADDQGAAVMAAQFRGRGLLCAVDSPRTKPSGGAAAAAGGDELKANNDSRAKGGEPSSVAGRDGAGGATRPQPALSRLPSDMAGVVLASSTGMGGRTHRQDGDASTRPLRIVERFDHVYSWQHEHSVEKVVRDQCLGGAKADRCGLRAAQEWMKLADAVHAQIPLP